MVTVASQLPPGRTAPTRSLKALVFSSGGTRLGTWNNFSNEIRFSSSSRTQQDSVEFILPRPLGLSDAPNEIGSLSTVQLGNRVDLYVGSWRTLAGMQIDAGVGGGRSGNAATDLSRLVWSGTIIAISFRPNGVRVVCNGGTVASAGAGTTHVIPRAALLDYDLEIGTYLTGITYSGWALISAASYDIDAVRVGDTMRVNPTRIFNTGDSSRYDAYEDANRTIASLEWSLSSLRVTFDTPALDLVMDQVTKLTGTTRDDATDTLTLKDTVTSTKPISTTDKVLTTAGIGVGNSAAATTPGTVVKKIQVFDATGASIGYVAVFDAIT